MSTPQPRLFFLNLPVADLPASIAFFTHLGFAFDPKFTDETATCMIISEQAYVMLLTREKFAEFSITPVADAHEVAQALMCVSAESREAVDAFADAALAAGATYTEEPTDYGFMYGRSFRDLDGHGWQAMWMDPAAAEAGPAEYAADTASA